MSAIKPNVQPADDAAVLLRVATILAEQLVFAWQAIKQAGYAHPGGDELLAYAERLVRTDRPCGCSRCTVAHQVVGAVADAVRRREGGAS